MLYILYILLMLIFATLILLCCVEEIFRIFIPLILLILTFLISYELLKFRDRKCHKAERHIVKNPQLPIKDNENLDKLSENFYNAKISEIKSIIDNKNYNNDNKNYNNATIAIIGKWGTGKSSILNILMEELNKDKKKYKVLFLDLISFYSSEQLYFNLIKALGLEFNYPYWKDLFLNYEVGLSSAGFDFKFLIDDPVNSEERLNHFKEHITKSLGNKKFILILDELDRLTDQQAILNVFKFINAFGRTKNLYLIAPIDRTAFLNIFEKKEYLVAGYLDKTFDFKVEVHPPLDLLKELFFEEIKEITRFIHKKNKNIFLTELEKKIFDEEFETILYRSSIFNFDSLRDVIKLRENVKQLINLDLLSGNIFLIDLILIEWLKYKHPLIWEILSNEYYLFCPRRDIEKEIFNKKLTEIEIEKVFFGKNIDKRVENFVNKLRNLLSEDQLELKSVSELIYYLIYVDVKSERNLEGNENVEEIFSKKVEERLGIKLSVYLRMGRFEMKEKDKKTENILKFKRLFRLHNLKIYLGLQDYLIKIDEKKFKTLSEIIDNLKNNKEEFEEKIINEYTKDLYKIPEETLISIRDLFLEEILIDIISHMKPDYLTMVEDIYKKIENRIEKDEDKIGSKNVERAKENLKEIFKKLSEAKIDFNQLN